MVSYPLNSSERQPLPGARSIGKAVPTERLEVTLVLRHRQHDQFEENIRKIAAGHKSERHLTHDEYDHQFGADSKDIQTVRQFANQHGLAVVAEHPGRRAVVLSGTVAQFNDAFGVELEQFEHPGGSYRGRTGAIHLPNELNEAVTAVLGLDNRPVAKPRFHVGLSPANAHWSGGTGGVTTSAPLRIASLCNFKPGGCGECIGIIQLGGREPMTDLSAYFSALGISPAPKVTLVSADHGKNRPTGDPNGPDRDVMLDIVVVGAIAPQAKIAVYFAPNTDAGFFEAITTAIHDATNKPSVISISWGAPEPFWTQQSLTAFDQAFQAAATMGITVCVTSGDNASAEVADGCDHVDFPASSPFALACGGTSLQVSGRVIVGEAIWDVGAQSGKGGRGVSSVFPLPPYQEGLQVKNTSGATQALVMRGVPDAIVIGGSGAVAPLWAGNIGRINAQNARRTGFINPTLFMNDQSLMLERSVSEWLLKFDLDWLLRFDLEQASLFHEGDPI